MLKFNCIIVTYNKKISSIDNIQFLNNNKTNVKLTICDNSEEQEIRTANHRYCMKYKIKYSDMHGNKGLSRAYNEAIKELKNDDWMVIFDQDTDVPIDYFSELEKSIAAYPSINIHVPVVKSIKGQMSPSKLNRYCVKKILSIAPGAYTDITAINSGMAIRKEVFDAVGNYNENIFLDYLDHFFIREYHKHFRQIAVFDCVLNQEFSDDDHSNFSRDLKRFQIYKNDFYEFCKDSATGRIYYLLKLSYRAAKLSIAHKKIGFLKMFMKGE